MGEIVGGEGEGWWVVHWQPPRQTMVADGALNRLAKRNQKSKNLPCECERTLKYFNALMSFDTRRADW